MRSMKSLMVAGAGVALAVSFGSPVWSAPLDAPLSTPPGITIQELGQASRYVGATPEQERQQAERDREVKAAAGPKPIPFFAGGGPRRGGDRGYTYANAGGMALYTNDKDTEKGKSFCYDDCAKAYPAVAVVKGAKASGDWSIISRTDGVKQWAYRGKPVYTFAKETAIGQARGAGAGAEGGWRNLKFDPAADISLPFGMGIAEAEVANGYVLVDSRRMTVYTFDGDVAKTKTACATSTCPDHWLPVAAAMLANPRGDFTLLDRADGVKQWAYKGKPLFTYGGDHMQGDANGVGVDKKYQAAMLVRHFMPTSVSFRQDISRGPIVTTADGMTLYRRDTSYHQPDGHGLPGSTPGNPSVGRAMGVKSCRDECLKTWRPFMAPESAVSQGFFDVVERPEGGKQWAYKGFALYTYPGDKKPGDKTGSDIYDILITDDVKKDVLATGVVNTTDSATMFWVYVEP